MSEIFTQAVQFHRQGRLADAESAYRQVLALDPNHVDALHLMGVVLHQRGHSDTAIAYIQRAIELKGDEPPFHNNLGKILRAVERFDDAVAAHRRAIERNPAFVEAYNDLGKTLKAMGRFDESVATFRIALQLKPTRAEIHLNLGNAYFDQGKYAEAVIANRQAVQLDANSYESHNNLGVVLRNLGTLDEAVASFQRALELKPDSAETYNSLGNAFKDQGRLEDAVAAFRRALESDPSHALAQSNLLYSIHFHPNFSPDEIYEEHRRWNEKWMMPLAANVAPHSNDRSPSRRLRIGYVSPDFRNHVVGLFLLPLFEQHDHSQFEIFAYSNVLQRDSMTDRFQALADQWRDVSLLNDQALERRIREDKIDILVDLAMHMLRNRLPVLARKPAPIQATYLAYCGTTGLSAIDYRLTDSYMDPPDQPDSVYAEKSIRLPETYWCYRPMFDTPSVGQVPSLQNDVVTFGCLNNFCKVSVPTFAAWIQLLQAIPHSRLFVHARPGSHRDRAFEQLAAKGVAPDRLTFIDLLPNREYLEVYQQIDIALDPFPYGGGTTTLDALWMGVPVVTLAGQRAVGRGGLSILSNVGLTELAARDAHEYVRIAIELALDLPKRIALRESLRGRLQASPLMDAPRFASNIEAAYRKMWLNYCDDGGEKANLPSCSPLPLRERGRG